MGGCNENTLSISEEWSVEETAINKSGKYGGNIGSIFSQNYG